MFVVVKDELLVAASEIDLWYGMVIQMLVWGAGHSCCNKSLFLLWLLCLEEDVAHA